MSYNCLGFYKEEKKWNWKNESKESHLFILLQRHPPPEEDSTKGAGQKTASLSHWIS